jgi:hypothetical protein
MKPSIEPGNRGATSLATSAFAWEVRKTRAPQSFAMYSTSGAVSRELMAV